VRVFLVRHAEAEPGDADEPDELRRLTSRGREQARDLGRRFAGERERPGAVISSPLVRARETADAIAEALDLDAEPDDRLGPGCTADDLREAVRDRGATIVAIAHQPDCGRIAAAITGGAEPRFPPAGVFEVAL
jgi:phosphohistidine phosphatase